MKVKLVALCMTIVWSLSVNAPASAQSRDFKTALEECFWGLILTNEDQRGLSLGLNVVSGALGSYAYTSATLSEDTFCAEKTTSTASFIKDAYPALIEDTARGAGEHLVAVLGLAGCNPAEQAVAIPLIRADMALVVSAAGYSTSSNNEKAYSMFKAVNLRSEQVCSVG